MKKQFLIFTVVLLAFSTCLNAALPSQIKTLKSSYEDGSIICRKTEFIDVQYSPNGTLLSKRVSVDIEVYNNHSSPVVVDVIDRARCINTSTLSTLYDTPNFTRIEKFGNITKIIWENVSVNASKSIHYYYTAETFRKIPLTFNSTVYINGKKANITSSNGFFFVRANFSDTITLKLNITNIQENLFVNENFSVVPPLMCTISAAFSKDYFSGVESKPDANSTSFIGDRTVLTWILFLDENPAALEASASVVDVGDWGEAQLNPITIQISSSTEMLRTYFKKMQENLKYTLDLMENSTQVFEGLNSSTYEMHLATSELADAIQQNTTQLLNNLTSFLKFMKASLEGFDSSLAFSQDCIKNANTSLTQFLADPQIMAVLADRLDLVRLINYTIANMSIAYGVIEQVRFGNGTFGGLNELINQTELVLQSLTFANASTEIIVEGLYNISQGLYSISNFTCESVEELRQPISELKEENLRLENMLLAIESNVNKPFKLEVKPSGTMVERSINQNLEKLGENLWALTSVNISNLANYNETVYGLAVQFEANESLLEPKVEVLVEGEWQKPQHMFELGIKYESKTKTLYFEPWIEIPPNSTTNILVDWKGRLVRIIVESNRQPNVNLTIDEAVTMEDVNVDFVESQTLCSLNQPYLLVQNITWKPPEKPSPPPEKTIWETIIEWFQNPLNLAFVAVILAILIIVSIYLKRRKHVFPEEKFEAEKIDANQLLEEIGKLEKELSEKG